MKKLLLLIGLVVLIVVNVISTTFASPVEEIYYQLEIM